MGQTHRHPDTFTCSFAPRGFYRHFKREGGYYIFNFIFEKKLKFFGVGSIFAGNDLPEKFPNKPSQDLEKGEPYQFIGKRDSSAQTDILLLLYKDE